MYVVLHIPYLCSKITYIPNRSWKKETAADGATTWTVQEGATTDAVTIGEGLGFSHPNRDSSIDNRLFVWRDGFLVPNTVEYLEDVSQGLASTTPLKSIPAMFNAEGLTVDQHCKSFYLF